MVQKLQLFIGTLQIAMIAKGALSGATYERIKSSIISLVSSSSNKFVDVTIPHDSRQKINVKSLV